MWSTINNVISSIYSSPFVVLGRQTRTHTRMPIIRSPVDPPPTPPPQAVASFQTYIKYQVYDIPGISLLLFTNRHHHPPYIQLIVHTHHGAYHNVGTTLSFHAQSRLGWVRPALRHCRAGRQGQARIRSECSKQSAIRRKQGAGREPRGCIVAHHKGVFCAPAFNFPNISDSGRREKI